MIGKKYIFNGNQPGPYTIYYGKGEVCTVVGANRSNITLNSTYGTHVMQTILCEHFDNCFDKFTVDNDRVYW